MDGADQNNWQYQPDKPQVIQPDGVQSPQEPPPQQTFQQDQPATVDPGEATISWTASEYVAHQKTSGWYLILGVGGLLVTGVVYAITRDIFAVIVIAFVCIAIGIFAARKPNTISYAITDNGVQVGGKFYPFSFFKSFSVMEEDAIECIWLRPLKRLMPTVAMYFAPNDEDKIVDTLSDFLPMEEREHDMIDRISRRVRF